MEKLVFISHAREADGKKADRIAEYLESHGIGCFIAPRDITKGASYAPKLVAGIDAATVVLLIGTPAIVGREHILNEIEIAVNKHKTIVQFVIEDYTPSDDLVYYISRKQKLIAPTGDYEAFLPTLENELRITLGLPEKPAGEGAKDFSDKTKYKVFQYLSDRGIMINPSDQHRNVSFRSDTFVTMFGRIYDSVARLTDPASAEGIFYDCGCQSGYNFGRRLQSSWDEKNEYLPDSPQEKLAKWCEFDSNVGWGKFDCNISIDPENDSLEGKLTVSECFLVDKSPAHRPVCAFIRGYCEAVIGVLLGDVEVKLTCASCPLVKKFKNVCEFDVSLK